MTRGISTKGEQGEFAGFSKSFHLSPERNERRRAKGHIVQQMALKKKRAMCKKSCGSGVDAVEEVKLGRMTAGRQKQRPAFRGAGLVASTDGFEQGGVRLVGRSGYRGQFVEEQAGQRALHPVMTAADQQEVGGWAASQRWEIRHHVIHHQTLVIHRMRQLGDEFTDDRLGIQGALGAALLL